MKNNIKTFFVSSILLASSISLLVSCQALAKDDYNIVTSTPLRQSITVIENPNKIQTQKYTIEPGDVFSLSIYDEPTLAQPEITVRPDGYATIEPLGEIYVSGYSIQSLTKLLTQKMSTYIRDPQISINIRQFHPASVYVYGAVQKPGMYQQIFQSSKGTTDGKNPTVKTDLNIANVISNAGGITYDADLSKVEITSEDGQQKTVNLWKFIAEGDLSQNPMLRSGDKIFIPKTTSAIPGDEDFKIVASSTLFPETFPVRIIGEVGRPGIYELPSKTPFLNSAIAMASGYNIDASKKVVQILRKTPSGNVSKIYVNPNKVDFVLRPNDFIDVRGKSFIGIVRFADYFSRFLSPIIGTSNAYNGWAEVFKPNRRYERD